MSDLTLIRILLDHFWALRAKRSEISLLQLPHNFIANREIYCVIRSQAQRSHYPRKEIDFIALAERDRSHSLALSRVLNFSCANGRNNSISMVENIAFESELEPDLRTLLGTSAPDQDEAKPDLGAESRVSLPDQAESKARL
jgi:hypothetical protein